MLLLIVQFMLISVGVRGQFQLSFGTQTPAAPKSFDPNCKDKLDTCWKMPESNCRAPYEAWAQEYCGNRCGYCIGLTTPAPPCVNVLTNCESYDKSVCTNPDYASWAGENCRYYCRLCPAAELNRLDSATTTIAPQNCVDKVDCRQYGSNACADSFKAWSMENCPNYCGFCVGLPTPPPVCQDKIPNCKAYNADTCSNADYRLWVEDNCKQYCGLCPGGSPAPAPVFTPRPYIPSPGGSPTLTQAPPMPSALAQTIGYQQPTPPAPGKKRDAEVKIPRLRRQFHASHHHSGNPTDCLDSNDPSCNTQAPDGQETTVAFTPIPTSDWPGSEFKPNPKPDPDWDHKPSTEAPTTTTEKTKPPVSKETTPGLTVITHPPRTTTQDVITMAPASTTTTTDIPITTGDIFDGSTTTEEPSTTEVTTSTDSIPVETTTSPGLVPVLVTNSTTAPPSPMTTQKQTDTTAAASTVTPPLVTLPVITPKLTTQQPTDTTPSSTSVTSPPTSPPTSPTTSQPTTSSPTTATSPPVVVTTTTQGLTVITPPARTLTQQVVTMAPSTTATPTESTTVTTSGTTSDDGHHGGHGHETKPPRTTHAHETKPPHITHGHKTTPTLTTSTTTTPIPTTAKPCVDLDNSCTNFGKKICVDAPSNVYLPFAKHNCQLFCEFCRPANFDCTDKITNCAEFDGGDLCTAQSYYGWALKNCINYCKFFPCDVTSTAADPTTATAKNNRHGH